MKQRINITEKNANDFFYFEKLNPNISFGSFNCLIDEYNKYLFQDAIRSLKDNIAKTWLFREHKTGNIAAYMALIMDAIKLSTTEKEIHNLDYPFKTIPAMKIAKLAVDGELSKKYKGIGTFLVNTAMGIATYCNDEFCSARFLTVDADIEHDEGVLAFYQKNGFIPNAELYNKNRKTISMRKDIYQ